MAGAIQSVRTYILSKGVKRSEGEFDLDKIEGREGDFRVLVDHRFTDSGCNYVKVRF